jgi:AcrR family transcriptional regulator
VARSATPLRRAPKAKTARQLKEAARRLTAEHGLSGFTVEELCEQVGVSRRTFFNYFASKENAVIGVPADVDSSAAERRFLTSGEGTAALLDDLVELHAARFALLDLTGADIGPLTAAFDREPRLIGHVLALAGEGEQKDIALVRRRTGLGEGDLFAATAVQLVGALFKAGVDELFCPTTTDDLGVILRRRLDAARALFSN